MTQEQYEQVSAAIFGQYPWKPEQAPEGLILHSAGPMEGGWYAYDIWESPEQFQRFVEAHVGPAMEQVLGAGGPGPEPQFYEIHGYVQAR
jgi:hypothetical protein